VGSSQLTTFYRCVRLRITPEQRNILLESFVRLKDSRSRNTGGAEPGLSVARNLVEAHCGTLAIGNAPGGGARITVSLPAYRW
jgi:signal transduction histidine kinase